MSEDIVADYELINTRLPPFWAMRGWADQRPVIEDIMDRKNTSARAILLDLLESLDVQEYLRSAAVDGHDLAALRERLLGPDSRSVRS